jgi:uncharacterized protein (DUF342 family)
MAEVKIRIREDGLYVENPQADQDFLDELKESLDELGASDFNESDFNEMLKDTESGLIRVSSILPQKHDDSIIFKLSEKESSKVIATIIPEGSENPLTKADILMQLEYDNYTDVSPDMKAIEKAIRRQKNETKDYSFCVGTRALPDIEITLTPDCMEASIMVNITDENQHLHEEDIIMALKKAGIVQGIRENIIPEIVKGSYGAEPIIIARGVTQIDGEPGTLIFHFDVQKSKHGPQIDDKGRADFHSLGIFESVEEGDTLCELIAPSEGAPGYNVKGKKIKQNHGKEAILPVGKNTIIDSKNPNHLIATISGIPQSIGGQVSIEPVLNIKGDAGLETGNINFAGDVTINGKVNSGFEIIAKGDIFINETCESVHLEAEGDIQLNRGVRAEQNAYLKAGGNIHAQFLEGVTVEADGDVVITDYAYHCNIKSKTSVRVLGKKGYITGCSVTAEKDIMSNRLGNRSAPRTEVYISPVNDKSDELTEEQISQMDELIEQLSEIQIEIDQLARKCSEMPDENSQAAKEKVELQKEEVINSIREIDSEFVESFASSDQYVCVVGIVYPNVFVHINRYKLAVKQEYEGVKFIVRNYKIVMEPFEASDLKNDEQ